MEQSIRSFRSFQTVFLTLHGPQGVSLIGKRHFLTFAGNLELWTLGSSDTPSLGFVNKSNLFFDYPTFYLDADHLSCKTETSSKLESSTSLFHIDIRSLFALLLSIDGTINHS